MSKKTVAALRIAALVLCLGVAAYFVTMIALSESANWFGLIAPILSSIALVMLLRRFPAMQGVPIPRRNCQSRPLAGKPGEDGPNDPARPPAGLHGA